VILGLLWLIGLVSLAGCASPSGSASRDGEHRTCVTLRGYQGDQLFELASESHTDRVEYYSKVRRRAARKVQSDEVMDALVEELDRGGFRRHAQDGPAPSRGGSLLTWSLEIERGEHVEHWIVGQGSQAEERTRFNECMNTFVQLYNVTASYQAVENAEGPDLFEEARARQAGRT